MKKRRGLKLVALEEKSRALDWAKKQSSKDMTGLAAFLKYFKIVVEHHGDDKEKIQNYLDSMIRISPSQNNKKEIFQQLSFDILEFDYDKVTTKEYSTTELARFMGVTVATINNWIKSGKLTGVKKESKYTHARIPETATYLTRNNEILIVSRIVEMYYKEAQESADREMDEVTETMRYFVKKYGGIEILESKAVLTPQERRDLSEWKYLYHRTNL